MYVCVYICTKERCSDIQKTLLDKNKQAFYICVCIFSAIVIEHKNQYIANIIFLEIRVYLKHFNKVLNS